MRVPMSMLKLSVGVPAVLASVVLWVVALALLPPVVGLFGLLMGAMTLGLLAAGVGEGVAVRLLAGARKAKPGEQAALAPLVARIAALELARDREVLVRRSLGARTPPTQRLGEDVLVVTPWLVEAPGRGWLSLDEAVALVVHADARREAERPRAEVAMLGLTLPARAIVALGVGLASGLAWVPLLRSAWALRGVVGAVAVFQQVDAGRAPLGIFAGGIVALTYLVPAAARAKAARVEAAADAVVVRNGLGPVFAGMLDRYRLPISLGRRERLRDSGPADGRPARPRLELVRG